MTVNETTGALVERICRAAKAAAPRLARAGTAARNDALRAMARGLRDRAEFLKAENAADVAAGETIDILAGTPHKARNASAQDPATVRCHDGDLGTDLGAHADQCP